MDTDTENGGFRAQWRVMTFFCLVFLACRDWGVMWSCSRLFVCNNKNNGAVTQNPMFVWDGIYSNTLRQNGQHNTTSSGQRQVEVGMKHLRGLLFIVVDPCPPMGGGNMAFCGMVLAWGIGT